MNPLTKQTLRPYLLRAIHHYLMERDTSQEKAADMTLAEMPDDLFAPVDNSQRLPRPEKDDLIGRKVRGWKFESIPPPMNLRYDSYMDDHVDEIGEIISYAISNNSYYIQFKGDGWNYPASEIHAHLIPSLQLTAPSGKPYVIGPVETEEVDLRLRTFLCENGLKGSFGTSYLDGDQWSTYKGRTCYCPQRGTHGEIDDYLGTEQISVESFFALHNIPDPELKEGEKRRELLTDPDVKDLLLGILKHSGPARFAEESSVETFVENELAKLTPPFTFQAADGVTITNPEEIVYRYDGKELFQNHAKYAHHGGQKWFSSQQAAEASVFRLVLHGGDVVNDPEQKVWYLSSHSTDSMGAGRIKAKNSHKFVGPFFRSGIEVVDYWKEKVYDTFKRKVK